MESIDNETSTIEQLESKLSQVRNDIKNVDDNIKTATGIVFGKENCLHTLPMIKILDQQLGIRVDSVSQDKTCSSRSNSFSKPRSTEASNFEIRPKIASKITTVKHPDVEAPGDEDDGGEIDEDDRSFGVDVNGPKQEEVTYFKKPELSENEIKRGSRMFGLMMKTFSDFKKDSEKSNEEMKKRDEIVAKVTEQEKQADALAKEERAKLLRLRNVKQREMVNLRKAIRYKELEQLSKHEFEIQSKFIKTKTHPPVFYQPRIMNDSTKAACVESSEALKRVLDEKIAHFHLSMSIIENNPHVDSTTTAANGIDKSIENELLVTDSYVEDDVLGSDDDD